MARTPPAIAVLAYAGLALAACGKAGTSAQTAAQAPSPPAATAMTPAPSKQSDAADFVNKAAAANAFELQAAGIAQQRASNADVKTFAGMMLRDHGKSADDLKKAVAEAGQSLSASGPLSPDQQQALKDIQGAQPADFDKTYMRTQVDAHQKALALMQDYAQNGTVTALQSFAAQAAPVVQSHLESAKQILDALK